MKALSKAVAVSILMLAGSQAMSYELGAGFEGSANIAGVSNYMWRGVSQTRNGAAVQGGLDLTHSSGFYAGTWLSNVDFKLAPKAHTEQDLYAGYGFTAGDFAFDMKYTKYLYDNASGLDFGETHVGVTAYGLTVGADYSNDTPIVDSDSTLHYYATYAYTLPADVGLSATVGVYDFKDAGWVGGTDDQYTYYNIGFNKTFWDINFGLAYTDSNIDDSNCVVFAGGDSYCGGAFVASAVKTFK
jgi:uncharacterized protein (TIGR02001 family)